MSSSFFFFFFLSFSFFVWLWPVLISTPCHIHSNFLPLQHINGGEIKKKSRDGSHVPSTPLISSGGARDFQFRPPLSHYDVHYCYPPLVECLLSAPKDYSRAPPTSPLTKRSFSSLLLLLLLFYENKSKC
jgi:hypothetical protein